MNENYLTSKEKFEKHFSASYNSNSYLGDYSYSYKSSF